MWANLAAGLLKSLFSGLFSFLGRDKARAEKERVEGLKAEKESIRRAANAERRIRRAMTLGYDVSSPESWNAVMHQE